MTYFKYFQFRVSPDIWKVQLKKNVTLYIYIFDTMENTVKVSYIIIQVVLE